jgi:hypothetical protein
MRANAVMFWVLAAFLIAADIAYIIWSLADEAFLASNHGSIDWVGAIAIGLSAVLSAFIAFYVGRSHAAQGGELPEDRVDANIDDGDAEQGFFAPWSWWPVMLAASAALVFLGLAVGVWVAFIGAAVGVISLVGWQYEFYRGYHAH